LDDVGVGVATVVVFAGEGLEGVGVGLADAGAACGDVGATDWGTGEIDGAAVGGGV